ncbi:MAG: hypothetical protein ACOX4F_05640 [Atopobiaceae bacterium]|jgi:glycine cleavage system aminomethyltransferase T
MEHDFTKRPRGTQMSVLYEEHLVLGANFLDRIGDRPAQVSSYADAQGELQALKHGTILCELSRLTTLLFSGAAAEGFAHAAFAGEDLQVGSCRPEAVFMGDGRLASVPVLARTGDSEFAVFDLSQTSQLLASWLSFLSNVESGGVAPYADLTAENVTGALVPLLLAGTEAQHVLEDYLRDGQTLPFNHEVKDIRLDGRIAAVVMREDLLKRPCYLVLVPPQEARTIWRSLLSFQEVTPVGMAPLTDYARGILKWPNLLDDSENNLSLAELQAYGIVRGSDDFVGARGLKR